VSDKRVVFVEDDPFLRRAGEASLRQRGFAVAAAADAQEGRRLAAAQACDLILLDLRSPGACVELLQKLRADAATAHVPVIVLSNSPRDDDRHDALAAGATAYLMKADISLRQLGDEVERVVARGGE
jgi:DNA-binding response OmpR family regulator